MKNLKFLFTTLGIFATSAMLQSCDNNDTVFPDNYPTALVTVCPDDDESFVMNLDENTVLNPVNIAKSPFGKKGGKSHGELLLHKRRKPIGRKRQK